MGRVPLVKYFTDCRSGANGSSLGSEYMVVKLEPIRNPLGICAAILCGLWEKVWGVGGGSEKLRLYPANLTTRRR